MQRGEPQAGPAPTAQCRCVHKAITTPFAQICLKLLEVKAAIVALTVVIALHLMFALALLVGQDLIAKLQSVRQSQIP